MSELKWVEIGELVKRSDERNADGLYTLDDLRGISIQKKFIDTKANMEGVSLKPYKLVKPNYFCYVTITSRNSDRITLALNQSEDTYIVSSSYEVFYVREGVEALPEYLYLWFSRPEFDRYARFNSWGSAREAFSYEDMERVRIPLPSIVEQRAIVDAWKSLHKVKEQNETLAEPLMQLCQSYIQECKYRYEYRELRPFIHRYDVKNTGNAIKVVKSVSVTKSFNDTNAKVDKTNLSGYKVVLPRQISFVQTTSNEKCLAAALSTFNYPIVVTSVNEVFSTDETFLLPEFLHLYFLRKEVDRYARFHSWGSARETFDWEDMQRMEIPLPPVDVQRAIVSLYQCALEYKAIAAEADAQARFICSALMQHAINS